MQNTLPKAIAHAMAFRAADTSLQVHWVQPFSLDHMLQLA